MRRLANLAAAVLLAGCATQPTAQSISADFPGRQYVLLGEVHDNAEGQRQRLEALTRAVEQGWRPAIAMEQFDREHQPDIERARRERPQDADYLIEQAGTKGWPWQQYRPLVALALRYDLPLVAANLSRADAAKIVRGGFEALFSGAERAQLRLARPVPGDIAATQTKVLEQGHCGNFPAAMLPGMLNAQAARDAVMAAALKPYASRGAVLIAGNGHVRADIGVARWLGAAPDAVLSVGYLESDAVAEEGRFDRIITVPPVARPDPCADAKPKMG
jgi:uncharacterized iron-regulated protein